MKKNIFKDALIKSVLKNYGFRKVVNSDYTVYKKTLYSDVLNSPELEVSIDESTVILYAKEPRNKINGVLCTGDQSQICIAWRKLNEKNINELMKFCYHAY